MVCRTLKCRRLKVALECRATCRFVETQSGEEGDTNRGGNYRKNIKLKTRLLWLQNHLIELTKDLKKKFPF